MCLIFVGLVLTCVLENGVEVCLAAAECLFLFGAMVLFRASKKSSLQGKYTLCAMAVRVERDILTNNFSFENALIIAL